MSCTSDKVERSSKVCLYIVYNDDKVSSNPNQPWVIEQFNVFIVSVLREGGPLDPCLRFQAFPYYLPNWLKKTLSFLLKPLVSSTLQLSCNEVPLGDVDWGPSDSDYTCLLRLLIFSSLLAFPPSSVLSVELGE